MDCVLDLTYLTEQERHWIAEVLNRDDEIQKKEDARVIRLKNKAARTNNPIIQKKIKMRTGEWFIELAEKQGSLKRIGSVNATVRASLRMKRKSKGKAVKASSPPVIEEIEAEPIRQDAESIDMQSHQEEVDATSSYPKHISSDRFDISGVGESYSSVDNEDKVEELSNALNFLQNVENDSDDKPAKTKKKKSSFIGRSTPDLSTAAKHKPTFGSSWSVYSTSSGLVRSDIEVSGSIEIAFKYCYKTGTLNVNIGSCYNLAAVDEKRLSNPYVKTYLLPDKHSKRKTKAKKRTLNPVYNETLKYVISESELGTRTLNVAVWHDKVGVNVFLGEVIISMDLFDASAPQEIKEYQLLSKGVGSSEALSSYNGDIEVAMRLTIPSKQDSNSGINDGQLEIVLKNVKNIKSSQSDGSSNVFVKGYFLPDKAHATKQKTPTLSGVGKINFDHLFVYTNVQINELQQRCLELSVWQFEKYTSNRLIGGVRMGPGTGTSFNNEVTWMDSSEKEIEIWQRMIKQSGDWVDGQLYLRVIDPWK